LEEDGGFEPPNPLTGSNRFQVCAALQDSRSSKIVNKKNVRTLSPMH